MAGRPERLNSTPLRTCAAGMGHWVGHDSTSLGHAGEADGPYLCPAHTRVVLSAPIRVGDRVRLVDGHYGADWHVSRVEGDTAVCGPPGGACGLVSVHCLSRADASTVRGGTRCGRRGIGSVHEPVA